MKHSPLEITLQDKFLVLHGSSTEAAGAVLRGSVILRLKETVKLRSLVLKLRGKVDVKWSSAAGPKPDNLKNISIHFPLAKPNTKLSFHSMQISQRLYTPTKVIFITP
ncbi:hypothetical protein K7432_015193 [Basidiobolus ranarum]|uniref:Arrestin-like N-terminal domain-containing protein n=1 Tax=Basidiobolus ranarum TaxID=34480 RepID=A0ABR2WGF5_9FUNG